MARPNLLDPKIRASKKKKQAIVLGVLFVAVLAISVPRTMKMMSPPAPETTASSVPTSGGVPATSALPTGSAPGTAQVAVATNGEAQLVVADLAPAPLEGQLEDFTVFDAKDPFVQQHVASSRFTPQGTAAAPTSSSSAAKPNGSAPAGGAETAPVTGSTSSAPSMPTTTTPTTQPSTKAAPTQTGAATISVNGVQETVNVASDFPAAAPLFRLVKLAAKSAKISIAGGTLATGAPTVTLELGKSLTLMNTADGTRYVLILVSTAATPAAGASTPTP
jgi:hypothetical protein